MMLRLATIVVVLLACSPLRVSGDATEESAMEQLQQAKVDLEEAHSELEAVNAELQAQTVDREEEPKQGNLRGTTIARSATDPVVVNETEVNEHKAEALQALAKKEFQEAESSMAKFFELKELRASRMREESAALDAEQEDEASSP